MGQLSYPIVKGNPFDSRPFGLHNVNIGYIQKNKLIMPKKETNLKKNGLHN